MHRTAVALIDDDQVEEIGWVLLVQVRPLAGVGQRLVEGEVHLATFECLALDLVRRLAKRRGGVVFSLVYQHIAVGQVKDTFLPLGLPQPPDDLEGDEGLAGAGGHRQQDAFLPAQHGVDGQVDGHLPAGANRSHPDQCSPESVCGALRPGGLPNLPFD